MRKVLFRTPDKVDLRGIVHPSSSDTVVIMCHCFLGDKDEWGFFEKIAETIHELGYAVLRFDMRGCGESDDAPISLNQLQDVYTAIDWSLQEGYQKVILLGHSLGGLYAMQAQHPSIISRIGLAPVTGRPTHNWNRFSKQEREQMMLGHDITKIFDKGVRKTHVIDSLYISEREAINQGELLTQISEPVLLIHGGDDTVIDVNQSVQAVPFLPAHSDLKVFRRANHDFDEHWEEVCLVITQWLNQL